MYTFLENLYFEIFFEKREYYDSNTFLVKFLLFMFADVWNGTLGICL